MFIVRFGVMDKVEKDEIRIGEVIVLDYKII